MNINSVTISGNLVRDAEVRSTNSGAQIVSFCVAVNERRKNRDGEWEDHPNFVECFILDSTGGRQWMVPALRKGFKVTVSGHLRYSSWEKNGERRGKLEVMVGDIDAAWPKRDQTQAYQPKQYSQQQQPSYSAPATQPQGVYDEDIPF